VYAPIVVPTKEATCRLLYVVRVLDKIREAPDDDDLRQVYADDLLRRGDPRGELISVQLRLAKTPDDAALRAREKELLDANRAQWFAEIGLDWKHFTASFERGFVDTIHFDPRQFPDFETYVRNGIPPKKLSFRYANEELFAKMLSFDALFTNLEELALFTGGHPFPILRALLKRPPMPKLRSLTLSGTLKDGLVELCASGLFAHLTELYIGMSKLTDAEAATIVNATSSKLRSLDFSENPPIGGFIERCIERLASLESLRLDRVTIEPMQSVALVFRRCENLVEFGARIPFGWATAAEAIDAMRLRATQLRTLFLADFNAEYSSPPMTAAAATAFDALFEELRAIECLRLEGTALGDRGARALARLQADTLVDLDISRSNVTIDGLRTILANPRFHRLRKLDVSGLALGAEGVAALAATPFTQLEELNVIGWGVFDLGPLHAISKDVYGDAPYGSYPSVDPWEETD
jgi:uncharacterized protein (TIGR02996 family)